ncbi:amidohydrolase [Bacteroides sp. 214]|uniref:amidohydrolase n=1 Tax=Bacteroides sp. 214 TaxID=2302935 RepID=UPI0013D175D8|nr:amidohydrolase [Bacteroides sp. 214]
MRNKLILTYIMGLLLAGCTMKKEVDLLIVNGNVYTVDSLFSKCSAIAVKDGIIVATGSDNELQEQYTSPQTIDLKGAPLYPGFNDTHGHLSLLGESLRKVDLRGAASFEEIVERLQKRYDEEQPAFLAGDGWDQNLWQVPELPTNEELNKRFPNIPVVLSRIDFHAVVANQKAIDALGLKVGDTSIPAGEAIIKNGNFTGLFLESTSDRLVASLPPLSREEMSKSLLAAQAECFKYGLTSSASSGEMHDVIELLDSMATEGSLKLRADVWLGQDPSNFERFKAPYRNGNMRISTIKLFMDGALGSRGALMLEPYTDAPSTKGIKVTTDEAFRTNCKWAYEHGFQVATHAIGDAANRNALRLYSEFLPVGNNLRWRIEHAQMVTDEDLPLFGKYGIVPSIQPTHATSDMLWADERVGCRLKEAYRYKDLLRQLGWAPSGTDYPVEEVNPIYTFFAATARQNLDFIPEGGFQPENALSKEEALRSMTIWAAKASFEESIKGSIEAGKYADFVVLDHDIMTVDAKQIPTTKVLMTIVGGEVVFATTHQK